MSAPSPVATLTALYQLHVVYRTVVSCLHFFSLPLTTTFGPLKCLLHIPGPKENVCVLALFFTASISMHPATSHHITSPSGSDLSPTFNPAAARVAQLM
jgi:hypothetical protein